MGWSLIRAAHRVERDLTALLAAVDLSPVQFGVLATLATGPACTQAQLARTVLVRPQSMAGVVATMVARDLLVRAGPGGRGVATPLTITEHGHEVLARAWPMVADAHGPERLGTGAQQTAHLLEAVHHLTGAPSTSSSAPDAPTQE